MTVSVDRAKCTGLGICESIASAVFEVDDDDMLVIAGAGVAEAHRGAVEQAVASCPTGALSLSD